MAQRSEMSWALRVPLAMSCRMRWGETSSRSAASATSTQFPRTICLNLAYAQGLLLGVLERRFGVGSEVDFSRGPGALAAVTGWGPVPPVPHEGAGVGCRVVVIWSFSWVGLPRFGVGSVPPFGVTGRVPELGERAVFTSLRLAVAGVLAQIDDISPSTDGMPGAELWTQILGWLAWAGLAGSLASLFIGGAVWGLSHAAGNSMQSSRGRAFALGGAAGSIVVGLAPTIVNELSAAG